MKKIQLFFILLLYCSYGMKAQEETNAPYFLVKSADNKSAFPLLHTEAEVNIAGVIAEVTVKQVYKNDGKTPIEAVYIFPASTSAAVHGMTMQIGERRIKAKVEEKEKARKQYAQAKTSGKQTSLLEQHRPNVLQMKVANIMPNDTVIVELVYTELLTPEAGTYEFVYPTVVGPRYGGETPQKLLVSNKWVGNPYLKKGEKVPYSFDLDICLNTGITIQKIQSTSHKININYEDKNKAIVQLDPSDIRQGNKDFILQYQLNGQQIESGLLCYEGEKENFFLLMVQPPKRPKLVDIPNREYIFVLDVSGSMNGFPLDVSKSLLKKLVGNLKPTDKFNVFLFAGDAASLAPQSLDANPQNIQKALQTVEYQSGGGGTNMLAALKKVMATPKTPGYARTFIIATDGYINVEANAFEYIENNLDKANFFAFGIGSGVNRHLIEGIATVGKGSPFIIGSKIEATEKAERFRQYIQSPLLTDIQVKFKGVNAYDLSTTQFPDLFAERPLILMGKYQKGTTGKIEITGSTGKGKFKKKVAFPTDIAKKSHPALRQLWARQQLKSFADYDNIGYGKRDDLKQRITKIGLDYNLLTQYTSFIAIDEKIVNSSKQLTPIKQPLPLPDKVENSAIGQNPNMASFGNLPPPPPTLEEVPEEELEDISFPDNALEISEDFEVEPPRTMEPPPFPESSNENAPNIYGNWGPPPPPPPPPPEPEVEEVFKVVGKMPQLGSCADSDCSNKNILAFISKNMKYPTLARENGLEGTVVIQIIIGKDGSIESAKIVRDIGGGCGAEALRIVKQLPKFTPATQRGKPVRVQMNIPVKFRLK